MGELLFRAIVFVGRRHQARLPDVAAIVSAGSPR